MKLRALRGSFRRRRRECPDVVAEARVARADDYGAVAFRFDAVVAGSNAEEGLTGAGILPWTITIGISSAVPVDFQEGSVDRRF